MASKHAERLEKHKTKMRAAGFKRLSVWVCPELVAMLAAERRPRECGGRTLERLLLGEARKRPNYWTEGERAFLDQYAQAREGGNI
ncbi:protein of unknown function [Ralstonia solanacearum CMR15]|uniref:hypothetical protein n=1 Tax=Ralstonia pseudosolanacearum TaxID=1310165 RepID=UPI0001D94CDE|nr:hypothetical protein [Ralstonia pseudosolanacearum]CBJ38922.1 protein of unknown function [Ralstonia solanacearum CMR15]